MSDLSPGCVGNLYEDIINITCTIHTINVFLNGLNKVQINVSVIRWGKKEVKS